MWLREKTVSSFLPMSGVCIYGLTEINGQLTTCVFSPASCPASFIFQAFVFFGDQIHWWILAVLGKDKRESKTESYK